MKDYIKRILTCVFIATLSISLISCTNSSNHSYPVNDTLINSQNFSVNADSLGLDTAIEGVVFVKGTDESLEERYVQIVASLEIDPDDWAGVSILIPEQWNIIEITSNYPQGASNPTQFVTILQSGASDYPKQIWVGNSKLSLDSGGGKGTIVVELILKPAEKIPANLELHVNVGSKGDTIQNAVGQIISVPLFPSD